jgi:hypothetical protein
VQLGREPADLLQVACCQLLVEKPPFHPREKDADPWLGNAIDRSNREEFASSRQDGLRDVQICIPLERSEPEQFGVNGFYGMLSQPVDAHDVAPAIRRPEAEGSIVLVLHRRQPDDFEWVLLERCPGQASEPDQLPATV